METALYVMTEIRTHNILFTILRRTTIPPPPFQRIGPENKPKKTQID